MCTCSNVIYVEKDSCQRKVKKMHEKAHGDGDKEELAYAGGIARNVRKGSHGLSHIRRI